MDTPVSPASDAQEDVETWVGVRFLKALPGYPWLPCPICKGVEGCSDTVPERARAAGHNIPYPFPEAVFHG